MSKYRRLTKREKNKILFMKKLRKFILKNFKVLSILSCIFLLCIVTTIAFYMSICTDSGKDNNNILKDTISFKNKEYQSTEIAPLSQKELERESKKEEDLDSKIDSSKKDICNKGYDFSSWNKKCPTELIVINKDNPLDDDFLVRTKSCKGKEISVIACDELENMIKNAKKNNINLWISSGYRSIELQTKLFNRQVEREKSKKVESQEEAERLAATVVARPKTSEHNTGLAVDFNGVEDSFCSTKEYEWLVEHCTDYGFIERYRKGDEEKTGVIYEPWHFRYVGKDNAIKIKESGLCLEEYVEKNLINGKGENNL